MPVTALFLGARIYAWLQRIRVQSPSSLRLSTSTDEFLCKWQSHHRQALKTAVVGLYANCSLERASRSHLLDIREDFRRSSQVFPANDLSKAAETQSIHIAFTLGQTCFSLQSPQGGSYLWLCQRWPRWKLCW